MRSAAVLITALVATAAVAAPASATVTSGYSPGSDSLVVSSDAEGDAITIACSAGAVRINGAEPTGGALACDVPGAIEVDGGAGADTIDVRGVAPADWSAPLARVTLDGGEDADVLYGSPLDGVLVIGTLNGGGGEDLLVPGGETTVTGGPGDDRFQVLGAPSALLDGGGGTDRVAIDLSAGPPADATLLPTDGGLTCTPSCGSATDVAWASVERFDAVLDDGDQHVDAAGFSGSVRLDGRGGTDTLIGGTLTDELHGGNGIDLVEGGDGNDVIDGGDDTDTLRGGEDADTLEGGDGADTYAGGAGDDLVLARDDIADGGNCGPGHDTLVADAIDVVSGCEVVDLPPTAAPPGAAPPADPLPAPAPLPQPIPLLKRNPAAISPAWKVKGAVTTVTKLRIAGVAAGSLLELRCSGPKCPFTSKRTAKARKGVIDGLALLGKRAHKRLRAGQTLEVRVTAGGYVGTVIRFKARTGKQPTRTVLCLPAGRTKPQAHC